ncbi:cytochrome c biogenesis protein [Acrasis kona]|uniref:Cytochrome c biogenesis protein n=1 Tax=Acrasis kona TaxID=1008807 RepID=A0AAW2YZV4_9EUKA
MSNLAPSNQVVGSTPNDQKVGPISILKHRPDSSVQATVHNTTVTVHKFRLSNIIALALIILNTLILLYEIALIIMFSVLLNDYINIFEYEKEDRLAANLGVATLSVICVALGYLVVSISLYERLEQRVLTWIYLASLIIFGVAQLITAGFLFPYNEDRLMGVGIAVFIITSILFLITIIVVCIRLRALSREDKVPDFEEKIKTPDQRVVRTPLMMDIDGEEMANQEEDGGDVIA